MSDKNLHGAITIEGEELNKEAEQAKKKQRRSPKKKKAEPAPAAQNGATAKSKSKSDQGPKKAPAAQTGAKAKTAKPNASTQKSAPSTKRAMPPMEKEPGMTGKRENASYTPKKKAPQTTDAKRVEKKVGGQVVASVSEMTERDRRNALSHDEYEREAEIRRQQREQYKKEAIAQSLEFMELNQAKEANNTISGTVVGIERAKINNEDDASEPCCVVFYKTKKIYIPYHNMFCDPPPVRQEDETQMNYEIRQIAILSRLLGAQIYFFIKDIILDENKKADYCIGNRKGALLREQNRNFKANKGHPTPRMNVGEIWEADIIAVGDFGIRVCIGGADVQIPLHLLSHRWMESCHAYYEPGQKIRVKIHTVTQRTDGGEGLFVLANAKAAEAEDLVEKNLSKIQVGATYGARVSIIKTVEGKPRAYLYLESLDMPVIANSIWTDRTKVTIQPGWLVAVRISYINTTTKQVFCNVTHVISQNPPTT